MDGFARKLAFGIHVAGVMNGFWSSGWSSLRANYFFGLCIIGFVFRSVRCMALYLAFGEEKCSYRRVGK